MEQRVYFIRVLLWLAGLAAACAVVCMAAVIALYLWAARDLPDATRIRRHLAMPETMAGRICEDCGPVLLCRAAIFTNLEDLPGFVPKAFVAVEDAAFYQPSPVNFSVIMSAIMQSFRPGFFCRTSLSNITARLLLPFSPDRGYRLKRAILAWRLDQGLSRDEILTIYLNNVYLGRDAYGLEAGARAYFGKRASDLTLAEAAVLACLARSRLADLADPARHADMLKKGQLRLLAALRKLDWITPGQYQEAAAEPLLYPEMHSRTRSAGPGRG